MQGALSGHGFGHPETLIGVKYFSAWTVVFPFEEAAQRGAADFLNALIQAVPYQVHTVLTDNEVNFTKPVNCCSAVVEIRRRLVNANNFARRSSPSKDLPPTNQSLSLGPNI